MSLTSNSQPAPPFHVKAVLRLGDDALIHAQCIAQWCGHGPLLEEDIAMANIGLDYLGQARLLLSHAGQLEGQGRSEDDLAYFRNQEEFFNSSFVELSNQASTNAVGQPAYELDYATTITKLFLHAAFMLVKWPHLARSSDPTVAAVAQKAYKETQYHFEHAQQWLIRFGDGTAESASRAQNALNDVWRYTTEWFIDDATDLKAHEQGLCPLNKDLLLPWLELVDRTLEEALLKRPPNQNFTSNGKNGEHTEQFSYLLGEMQSLARQHPGVTW